METRRLTLIEKKEIAQGTTAFYFEKPEGFAFKAGQYFDLGLIDQLETDEGGNIRTFSIASAPHEPHIMIATRIRDSAFKRSLAALPLGEEVEMRGMGGSFVLHNKAERPAVLIAGGIGITPFRSMILDAKQRGTNHHIVMFHVTRTADDAPFLHELGAIPVLTATEGHLTMARLREHVEHLVQPIYYIVGSMGMVAATRGMLEKSGIDSDDIRSEDFPGY